MATSEHEQYYEDCRAGMFADADAAQCGCGGCGWFLSQVDTWHKCPAHYTGQPHPESDGPEVSEGAEAAPVAGEAVEVDDSDIPF